MKVYITFDVYDSYEWVDIYNISLKLSEVRKTYKDDLFRFINYGPDDLHTFRIVKVDLTKSQYDELIKFYTIDTYEENLRSFLEELENDDMFSDELLMTDGISDYEGVNRLYCEEKGLDPNNSDDYDSCWDELMRDDTLWEQKLREYIDKEY